MPVAVSVKIEGVRELQSRLRQINPQQNTRIIARSLRRAAGEIAANAKDIQIVQGGMSIKGLKPLKRKLTSRTGKLRNDIGVDTRGLPFSVEVGTGIRYGAVHEFGGTFPVRGHVRKRKDFMGPIKVKAHSRTYPARPFMQPALKAIRPRFPSIVRAEWQREAKL